MCPDTTSLTPEWLQELFNECESECLESLSLIAMSDAIVQCYKTKNKKGEPDAAANAGQMQGLPAPSAVPFEGMQMFTPPASAMNPMGLGYMNAGSNNIGAMGAYGSLSSGSNAMGSMGPMSSMGSMQMGGKNGPMGSMQMGGKNGPMGPMGQMMPVGTVGPMGFHAMPGKSGGKCRK